MKCYLSGITLKNNYMFTTEKITKLVGQVIVVAIGALIALKVNENIGKSKIAAPKKES